jgi:hypothetical protein
MASTIGKVRAVFTASTSGLTAGVNAASASMKKLQADASGLRSGMSALVAIQGTQLFSSIVSSAASAARSLANLVVSTAETVSAQNDLAGRLGVTYGELAGLSYAGSLVGVSMDTIGAAMTKAQVAFVNAANGSKTANAAFARLGLSVQQLNGLSAEQQFEAIAEAISQLPTEAERAAAAVQIFGRSGAQLLPLFQGGADGIREAREEAERFGLTLTNAQSGNIDAMGDSFDRAQAAITGVIQQIVAYLAPAVERVTTAFSNFIGAVGGANIGQAIGSGLLQGARFLAQIGDWLVNNLAGVWQYVSNVGSQWSGVVDFMNRVASFFSGVFNAAKTALGVLILSMTSSIALLAQVVQKLSYVNPVLRAAAGGTIDEMAVAAQAFTDEIRNGIAENAAATAASFSAAFAENASNVGASIAGPLTSALDDAIAQAEAAAAAQDQVAAQTVDVTQKINIDTAPITEAMNEAVKGVDSRSREGVAEMFRLMRGGGQDVQEQQLTVLERIAENTTPGDLEEPLVELAMP